ncbi:MAG: DUF2285 domain-containing protein [Alphaproteobacteria bacterium]|nr:DUF2285 domain-containing protein [Alphaproteobacteria bacterium]
MARRPKPSTSPNISDEAPTAPVLTNYDYELLHCYLRLLDAEAQGTDWCEVARVLLKADPQREYARAKRRYETHLARAHWMTEQGYRHLLAEADDDW